MLKECLIKILLKDKRNLLRYQQPKRWNRNLRRKHQQNKKLNISLNFQSSVWAISKLFCSLLCWSQFTLHTRNYVLLFSALKDGICWIISWESWQIIKVIIQDHLSAICVSTLCVVSSMSLSFGLSLIRHRAKRSYSLE